MKTAYLYIRVSTDEQADTGYSQRAQDELLSRYCQLNGITVKHKFFEDHSAKTFQRPEFSKLLLQLRKHRGIVDLVLFTKWDRFSRNAGDAYGMINTLNKLGVEPQAVEQPLNLEIPENKMMLAFYLAAPEVENDRRALNVFNGMRRARKEGRFMGKAPVGYKNEVVNGKKTIVPDPKQAPIMQWVFTELAKGQMTVRSIRLRATELGLRTSGGRLCSNTNFWSAIRNPVYCGKIHVKAFKGEEVQTVAGSHEALITEALYYAAQDVLDGKKRVARTKIVVDDRFPLRGYLLCPECGKQLTASSSRGSKGNYYHYYHCYSGCNVRFHADRVNEGMIEELKKYRTHPAVLALYRVVLEDVHKVANRSKTEELARIREELTALATKMKRARELLLAGDVDADDYRAIKQECEDGTLRLEARLAELSELQKDITPLIEKAVALLSRLDESYVAMSTELKRELVGSMFPEKLTFSESGFRTPRVNEAAEALSALGAGLEAKKIGQLESFSELSYQVAPLVRFSNLFLHDLRKLAALAA